MAAPVASGSAETLAVAIGLLVVDTALLVAHIRERRLRPDPESEADRVYYRDRDIRRGLGAAVMAAAACLMIIAARLDMRVNLDAARLYIGLWFAVMGMVFALLVLALLDWISNRRYASRHRQALAEERSALIAQAAREARRRRARRERRGGPPDPSRN